MDVDRWTRGTFQWYRKRDEDIVHVVISRWYSASDRSDYFKTFCEGDTLGFGIGGGWIHVGTTKDGWQFDGKQPTSLCPKCKDEIIRHMITVVENRKLAKQYKEEQAIEAAKRKARREKKKAEKHAKLVSDIREVIDSESKSTDLMANTIIKLVKGK